MKAPTRPPPVFVDDSGRRVRRLRTVLFVLAALVIVVAAVGWLSLSVAPVHPKPVPTCKASKVHTGCGR